MCVHTDIKTIFRNVAMLQVVGEGNGTPLQYSCLENPTDGGAWKAAVHGVAKSQIGLSDFPFTFHFHALEKEMATHSSVLAWRIPGTGKPGGLPSLGSHRVGHDWSDLAAAAVAACSHSLINVIFFINCFLIADYLFLLFGHAPWLGGISVLWSEIESGLWQWKHQI